jgi:2-polyprenyl-3-methyl-5-hydroxy-6-metoxy-1,4-benzoquinol methylase
VILSSVRSLWHRLVNFSMVRNEHFAPPPGRDVYYYLTRNSRLGVHHFVRYMWAARVLTDLDKQHLVLDVACGAGYGTHLMACANPDIDFLGIDYDQAAIRAARRDYRAPNLEFRHGDVLRWHETIGESHIDSVVSFDTLEHVPHREIMLENLVNRLQPHGRLLLTTPCGHNSNQLSPRWGAHQIEYSAASLYDFLSRYFRRVIRPDEGELPHLDVFDLLKGSGIVYLFKMNPVLCEEPIAVANPYYTNSSTTPSPHGLTASLTSGYNPASWTR